MLFLQTKSFFMEKLKQMSWFVKILLLAAFAMMMLIVVSGVIMIFFGARFNSVNAQMTMIALQNVLIFVGSVVILALICHSSEKRPVAQTLWITKNPTFKSIALVVLVYVAALPAMNWLVDWNNSLHLPQALHDVEKTIRDMEDTAQGVTKDVLMTSTFEGMLVRFLLVGVLTGIGEEMFFRAGMLGSMHFSRVQRHVAVWTVAFIFSAIHMQFFGFVPRMLMGAMFGYVFVWTGSLWVPIVMHFTNNGLAVLAYYILGMDGTEKSYADTIGAGTTWWLGVISLITVIVLLFFTYQGQRGYDRRTHKE